MDIKKFLIGTVVGGIASFFAGWLIYGMAMMKFHAANMTPDPEVIKAITKDPPDFMGYIVGSLATAALLTYIFAQWANIKTFATGLKGGAIIGLLLGIMISFNQYAGIDLMNMTATLVDPFVSAVNMGVVGGVVGLVLGKISDE